MSDGFEGWGEGSDTSESDSGSKPSERSEQSNDSDDSDSVRKPENVKQEWKGYYIYLPSNEDDDEEDEIVERINAEYERLRYECSQEDGVSIEKDRHFKPVLVLDGLERLESMEATEFLERVEELGFQ